MKLWTPLLATALVALTAASARAADSRFSQTLAAKESAEAGLNRLSSDQVAVIDALVRRDLAGSLDSPPKTPPPPARFSQRLIDGERRAAGFALLTEAELARLDALVDRYESAARTRALLAPPVFIAANPRVRVSESNAKTAPEIHGSFSLSMGWGSGGYSEKTGAMEVHYTDPVRGFSVSVGYAETHAKGPGVYLYRDPVAVPPPPLAP